MTGTFDMILKGVGDEGAGTFTAVISAPTLDRDGEVFAARCFEPLPASIPVHAFHNFSDPVGRGVPRYDMQGLLRFEGTFAKTDRAQEIRELVVSGIIGHMSVGFRDAKRKTVNGVPHVTRGELLEVSFVSVPSNRESRVLQARGFRGTPSHATFMAHAQAQLVAARAELALIDLDEHDRTRQKAQALLAEARRVLGPRAGVRA